MERNLRGSLGEVMGGVQLFSPQPQRGLFWLPEYCSPPIPVPVSSTSLPMRKVRLENLCQPKFTQLASGEPAIIWGGL